MWVSLEPGTEPGTMPGPQGGTKDCARVEPSPLPGRQGGDRGPFSRPPPASPAAFWQGIALAGLERVTCSLALPTEDKNSRDRY